MDDLKLYKRVDQLEKDVAELQELVYNQHQQIDTLSKICSSLITRLKRQQEDEIAIRSSENLFE